MGEPERTIASTPGIEADRNVNFGTDPYVSHLLNASITSDACRMPQHWEFGRLVDREGQLLLCQGLDGLDIGSLGSWWMEKND